MTRRWALAASLVLTVMVGFFVLTYGNNAGVFAWSGGGSATQAPTAIESIPPQAPAVAPLMATELVNLDQTTLQPSDQLVAGDRHEREGDDDGHERDHGEREHEGDD